MPDKPDYNYDNSPAVVPGRRITRFFYVRDPVRAGELSPDQARAVTSVLPAVLADTVLPIEGSDVEPSWNHGRSTLVLGEEIEKIRSPERVSALAEWLGGMPTRHAAEMATLEEGEFSNWIHHSARRIIGNPAMYSALVEASGVAEEQPSSIPPA